MRRQTLICVLTLLLAFNAAISIFTITAEAAIAETSESKAESASAENAGALKLYAEYVKLDQARDHHLIDLYAPNAHITICSKSASGDAMLKEYDRDAYAKLIAKAFADPSTLKISRETKFEEPRFGHHKNGLIFAAYYAKSVMVISWLLRKEADGNWKIADERATISRSAESPAKLEKLENSEKPADDLTAVETSTTADMHGIEQIRQFKRLQNSDGSPVANP